MEFDTKAGTQMTDLQAQLAIVLRRANTNKVEAAVAVFALMRLARQLLDKYPPTTRAALLNVCEAFLRHEDLEKSNLLVM